MTHPPIVAAVRDLHAATFAVILHTECQALQDSCHTYWTRALNQYVHDPDRMQQLETYLGEMKTRADHHAAAMAGSLPALMLRRLCDDAHLKL